MADKKRGRAPKTDVEVSERVISFKLTGSEADRLENYLNDININNRSLGIRKILLDAIDAHDKHKQS